jgi:hypothetical protein
METTEPVAKLAANIQIGIGTFQAQQRILARKLKDQIVGHCSTRPL